MLPTPANNQANPVIRPGTAVHTLAQAMARGDLRSDCARIFLSIEELAQQNEALFEKINLGTIKGTELIEQAKTKQLDPKAIAAVLYVALKKTPQEVQELLTSDLLKLSSPRVAASLIDSGIKAVAINLGITRKLEISSIWNYSEQERNLELVSRIEKWVENPSRGNIPASVIELPIACLVNNFPWLAGRQDQLQIKFRALTEEGKFKGSSSSTPIFAWVDVDRIGAIVLTISVKTKGVSGEGFNPVLARYLIGAACRAPNSQATKGEFVRASLLVSRTIANTRLKDLYPKMPSEQRVFQETLTMVAGGAIDLIEFEAPRHLKTITTTFSTENGSNVSRTAQLTPISNLLLEVSERRGNNKGEAGKLVTRRCKAVVGLSAAATLDCGIEDCSLIVSKEVLQRVARTGEFVGARFRMIGKTSKDITNLLGYLLFKERVKGVIPNFKFEPLRIEKNHREVSAWGQAALEWILKKDSVKPIGFSKVVTFKSKRDAHRFCIIGKRDITLSSLPEGLNNLIAYPVRLKIDDKPTNLLLLFSAKGKVEAAVYCTKVEGKKIIEATTAYRQRYAPVKGEIFRNWAKIKEEGEIVWTDHLSRLEQA
jgi:hypothetical protein